MISVISDCVLATVRTRGLFSVVLIGLAPLHHRLSTTSYNGVSGNKAAEATSSSFGNPGQLRKSDKRRTPETMSSIDKIAGLKEIIALDPKNSFARYGIAMELAKGGSIDEAMAEFDTILANDPDYTAAYFMAAQTLTSAGRTSEAIERLRAGIACAARSGNRHAMSEMQGMLDELDR
jgi:thioredoxin-like negative regulator of GroEL